MIMMMMIDDHCCGDTSRLWKYETMDLTTGWLRGTATTPFSAGERDSERLMFPMLLMMLVPLKVQLAVPPP